MSLDSHVAALRSRHAEADRLVEELERSPSADTAEITAAKKRKLALKDQIEQASTRIH
jgi:Uncharacterized small protein